MIIFCVHTHTHIYICRERIVARAGGKARKVSKGETMELENRKLSIIRIEVINIYLVPLTISFVITFLCFPKYKFLNVQEKK